MTDQTPVRVPCKHGYVNVPCPYCGVIIVLREERYRALVEAARELDDNWWADPSIEPLRAALAALEDSDDSEAEAEFLRPINPDPVTRLAKGAE